MLRIAICDDNKQELQKILEAAQTYYKGYKDRVEYSTYDSSFQFLEAASQGAAFDLILLDICMPGMLGTEAAKELRDNNNPAEIIFLTTSEDYAVDAFAVKATDYVVKPFTQEKFNKALDRAMLLISQRQSAKLIFRLVGGGIRVEKIANILFFESQGHILQAYLNTGEILETRKTAQDMKADLDKIVPGQFQSPNKGYLVNLEQIRQIKSDAVEIGDHKIPLGRRKFRDFQKAYFDFMFHA